MPNRIASYTGGNGLYTDGLVALHNLGVVLEHAQHTPRGSPGYPLTTDPLEYVVDRMWTLMSELTKLISCTGERCI